MCLLRNIFDDLVETIQFFFLGIWEQKARLFLLERALDDALRNTQVPEAVERARLAYVRAEKALMAGRTLDLREEALANDLRSSGATILEIWLLFAGKTVRSERGKLLADWRAIEWAIFAIVASATALMVMPVVALSAEAAIHGQALHLNSLCIFALSVSLNAWVWDLYLIKPLALVRKWRGLLSTHCL